MSALTDVFTDIANSIRSKMGGALDTFKPTEMANAINNIPTGSGPVVINTIQPNGILNYVNFPVIIEPSDFSTSLPNIVRLFENCRNFNSDLIFNNVNDGNTNGVGNMAYCFSNAANFNRELIIPGSVNSMIGCFSNAYAFNSQVHFTRKIVGSSLSLARMFANCRIYNQPINLLELVNESGTWRNFNQYCDMSNMFFNCQNFSQDIYIPGLATITNMFNNCKSFEANVIFPEGYSMTYASCTRMFNNMYNSKRKNIYVRGTGDMTAFLNDGTSSIVGVAITWSANSVCAWNDGWNIYIYNDR